MAGPAMWVTRQIATHTERTVALIDYLSAVTPPFSYHTYVSHGIEISDPRLRLATMILVGEKKRREKSHV